MKVTSASPVRTNNVKRTQRLSKGNSGAFSENIKEESEVVNNNSISGPASLASVDSLIALQEVGDSTSGQSRAVIRGEKLLNLLDEVRLGLLSGRIPKAL